MTIYCLGFLFVANPDDPARPKVVLIRKKRGPANVRGKKNGIGGKIELPDETPLAAMIREAREEIGIVTDRETWLPFGVMSGPDWRCHLFTGWLPDGQEPRTMEDEEVGVELAAACFGDSYVANIPTLLALAGHALDSMAFAGEAVWSELRYLPGEAELKQMATGAASMSAVVVAPFAQPYLSKIGPAKTGGFWGPQAGARRHTISAVAPSHTMSNSVLDLSLTPWTSEFLRYPAATIDLQGDQPYVALPDDYVDPTPRTEALLGAGTIKTPKPFFLHLGRYARAVEREAGLNEAGEQLPGATIVTDWSMLADDFERYDYPTELVEAVRRIGEIEPKTKPTAAQTIFAAEMARYGFYEDRGHLRLAPFDVILTDQGANLYLNRFLAHPDASVSFSNESDSLELAALAIELAQDTLDALDNLNETLAITRRTLRDGLRHNVSHMIETLVNARRHGGEKAHVAIGREVPPTRSAEEVIAATEEIIRTAQAVAEAAAQAGPPSSIDAAQVPKAVAISSTGPILGLSEAVKPIVVIPGQPPMLGFIDDGLGAYCPRHPLLAWAAMGQTATGPQRTVRADWGIAFGGDLEPVASFAGDEVEIFWAPVGLSDDELAHLVPIDVDRIRWPFVESEARPEHFAALGFRVLS